MMTWIKDRVGTAAMMREMDRKAIEEFDLPGLVLMENAGRGAFEFLWEEFHPRRVTVFAGKGNNGGDGYVIARHLMNAGVEVETVVLANPDEIAGDARTNLEALMKMGGRVAPARDIAALEDNRFHIAQSDLLVDAILGTGLQSEVRGFYRQAIEFINGLVKHYPHLRVFAVDLPSGLNADTGQVMGVAVAADATCTFGMLKTGHLSYPGASLCGTLALVDISLPRQLYYSIPYRLVLAPSAADLLPERDEDCHKGTLGHGLVLAGSPGKTGAAVMAAESALRSGAGLVTLAGPESLHSIFETKTLEVMTEPLPDRDGALTPDALPRVRDLMSGKTALALGPGIGRGPARPAFIAGVIAAARLPLVIDADGLNAIAEELAILDHARGPVIITPHPGEMARLLRVSTQDVLRDRLNAALAFARDHNVIVLLKGAYSITATPEGRAFYNTSGNPGLATAGAGDVLTGLILGLLSQGLAPREATILAAFLHGHAADLALPSRGPEGLLARDVMEHIPAAFLDLRRRGEDEENDED
jgi:NAD(P)H-hydrate epimerase